MEKALPFPYRVVDYAGSGLLIGACCIPYFAVKGARWSPPGEKLFGAVTLVKGRSPAFLAGFALWGASVGTFECALESIRGVDDPLNRILSVGLTRGLYAARAGPRLAVLRTVEGIAIFGLIELFSIAIDKHLVPQHEWGSALGDPNETHSWDHDSADTFPPLPPHDVFTNDHIATLTPTTTPTTTTTDTPTTIISSVLSHDPPSTRPWLGALAMGAGATAASRYRYPLARTASRGCTRLQ